MNTAKKLSIRLEAVGGNKVRQEFKNIGSDGQKAFQRITQVIRPANDNLKVLDNTAKAFNNTLKQAASFVRFFVLEVMPAHRLTKRIFREYFGHFAF